MSVFEDVTETPRFGWPIPTENNEDWYDIFGVFANQIDSATFAAWEDRNLILFGETVFTWNNTSGRLSWTTPWGFLSPTHGQAFYLPASGYIQFAASSVSAGNIAYLVLSRGPTATYEVSFEVDDTVPISESNKVFAYRISDRVYIAPGFALRDGDSLDLSQLNAGGGGGGNLNSLSDVTIASPVDGQVLVYEASSNLWKNKTLKDGSDYLDTNLVLPGPFVNAALVSSQIDGTNQDSFVRLDGITSGSVFSGELNWIWNVPADFGSWKTSNTLLVYFKFSSVTAGGGRGITMNIKDTGGTTRYSSLHSWGGGTSWQLIALAASDLAAGTWTPKSNMRVMLDVACPDGAEDVDVYGMRMIYNRSLIL